MNMNILAAAALLVAVGPAHAQQYQTLNTGQSSPVWNTSAPSWSAPSSTNVIGSTFASTWTNGNFATFANPQTVNVTAPVTAAGFQFAADNVAIVGSSTVTLSYSNPFIDNRSGGENNLISATLAGTAGLVVYGSSNSRVTFAGVNTYTGSTTVSLGGALAVGTSTSGGFGAFGSSNNGLTVNDGTTADLNGFNLGVGSLGGTGTVTNSSSTIGTLTAGNNGSSASFSGTLSGGVALTKAGSGTLTLAGMSNTFTGATQVNAGTLSVTGLVTTSTVTVTGGTLAGTGTVGGTVAVNGGGTLSPGIDGSGVLTLGGGLTFAGQADRFSVELNGTTAGTGYDQAAVTGAIALNGATLLLTLGYSPAAGDKMFILTNNGTDPISGTFNGLANGAAVGLGGQTANIYYNGDSLTGGLGGNDVLLVFQAVPEPGTVGLLAAAGLGLAGRARRRRTIPLPGAAMG